MMMMVVTPICLGLVAGPLRVAPLQARIRPLCLSLADASPSDSPTEQEVYTAVRSALADGKKALSVEAFGPTVDEYSAGKLPASTVYMAIECAKALAACELDEPLLLLLPSLAAVAQASAAAATAQWPNEHRDRLRIANLALQGGPDDREPKIGGVILCGLSFDGDDATNPLLRDARAWLRFARNALCVNSRVPMLRFEAALYVPVFSQVPYEIHRQLLKYGPLAVGNFLSERIWVDAHPEAHAHRPKALRAFSPHPGGASSRSERSGGAAGGAKEGFDPLDDVVATEAFGRALLSRAYPGSWRVLLDAASSGEFDLIAELPSRPTDSDLTELVLPSVKARRAALESAVRALRDMSSARGGEEEGASATIETRSEVYEDDEAAPPMDGGDSAPRADEDVLTRADEDVLASAEEAAASAAAAAPLVVLLWADIQTGPAANLHLYQSMALLRQRCYGQSGVSFAHDEVALHIVQPYRAAEAAEARAKSAGYGRLNGDVRGALLLLSNLPAAAGDGGGGGGAAVARVARVEQLSIQRDATKAEKAACAAALLAQAAAEATARHQGYLIVPPLPPALRVEGTTWLERAGFAPPDDATPEAAKLHMSAGAMGRALP